MTEENQINWDDFAMDFVKIVAGKPKVLLLQSVRQKPSVFKDKDTGSETTTPSLEFNISEEDGMEVSKKFTVTSRRLVKLLRPVIEKNLPRKVQITQFGTGYEIEWEVKEIE